MGCQQEMAAHPSEYLAERSMTIPSTHYLDGLSNAPPWIPRISLTQCEFRQIHGPTIRAEIHFRCHTDEMSAVMRPWPLYGVVTAMDYDTPNMQVAQWNLSLQRQIGADWLVSASYIGNGTSHLWATEHINLRRLSGWPCTLNGVSTATCSTTANTNQRRRLSLENPADRTILRLCRTDRHRRHGQLQRSAPFRSAPRGPWRHISGNYTWSHCITDPWQDTANSGQCRRRLHDPDNRRFDRGNCTTAATTGGMFSICRQWPKRRSSPTRPPRIGFGLAAFAHLQNPSGGYHDGDHQSG